MNLAYKDADTVATVFIEGMCTSACTRNRMPSSQTLVSSCYHKSPLPGHVQLGAVMRRRAAHTKALLHPQSSTLSESCVPTMFEAMKPPFLPLSGMISHWPSSQHTSHSDEASLVPIALRILFSLLDEGMVLRTA
eukprot:scaffold188364_cov22-Tisochrysis_lutea.AAC.1